mmetsp:Transcript_27520/g.55509  ORF Transcript_27520/g.55509 Transcript_27520/m.55509 type:complete len:409 (-) Transcript_27520:304-1530(-)
MKRINQQGIESKEASKISKIEHLADANERTSCVERCSFFESLPPGVLESILLEYIGGMTADLRSLLRLAVASKSLQRQVYRGCSCLWKRMDFSVIGNKRSFHLTDRVLSVLLSRVNAVNVTEYLSLFGCYKICGSGLVPLRGSTVLKEIDLRLERGWRNRGDETPAHTVICTVLRSMPPFQRTEDGCSTNGLRLIQIDRLRTGSSGREHLFIRPPEFDDLFNTFGRKVAERLEREGEKCNDCGILLYERLSTLAVSKGVDVGSLIPTPNLCFLCKNVACGQGVNCNKVQICFDCKKQICTECKKMDLCKDCGKMYCCHDKRVCYACKAFDCGESSCHNFSCCQSCRRCYACDDCSSLGLGLRPCRYCRILGCTSCRLTCPKCNISCCTSNRCRNYHLRECSGDLQALP